LGRELTTEPVGALELEGARLDTVTVTGTAEPFRLTVFVLIVAVIPFAGGETLKATELGVLDDGVTFNMPVAVCPAVTTIAAGGVKVKSGMFTVILVMLVEDP
jgi:hypothetical protein